MPYKVGQRMVYMVGEKREEFPVNDAELPPGQVQNYVELKNQARATGVPFVDPLFNPDTKDIIGTRANGKRGITCPIVAWKRPRNVDNKYVFGEKDEKGRRYSHNDMAQGRLGDCYYIAAVSIVSDNDKLINFIIPEDNNEEEELGIFHFRFWINGYYFDIVVDDRIPYKNETEPGCAKLRENEFWPLLIEKAYAKMHGNYAAIGGGHTNIALEHLTGGILDSVSFANEIPPWDALVPNNNYGMFIGLGTNSGSDTKTNPETGLVYGHAYSVLGAEVLTNNAGERVRLLCVRNPHGHNEWIGDWSDFPTPSPKWDTISVADKERLLTTKDEGQFWISYEDATNTKNFEDMSICYWLPNLSSAETQQLLDWKEIHGEWEGTSTGQGLKGWELIASRPQYRVHLKPNKGTEAALIVSLMLKGGGNDKEVKHRKLTLRVFEIMDEGMVNEPLPYEANAFRPGKLEERDAFKVSGASQSRSSREMCSGTKMKEGHYLITPYTEVGVEGRFLLRIICEGQVETTSSTPPLNDNSVYDDDGDVEYYRGWEDGYQNM